MVRMLAVLRQFDARTGELELVDVAEEVVVELAARGRACVAAVVRLRRRRLGERA